MFQNIGSCETEVFIRKPYPGMKVKCTVCEEISGMSLVEQWTSWKHGENILHSMMWPSTIINIHSCWQDIRRTYKNKGCEMAHHGLYPKGQASYSFCFMSKVKQQRKPTTTPPTKKKKTTQKIQYLLVKAPYEYRFVVILFNHNIIK